MMTDTDQDMSQAKGTKRPRPSTEAPDSNPLAVISFTKPPADSETQKVDRADADASLLFREQKRLTFELNPQYVKQLRQSNQFGYYPLASTIPEMVTVDLDYEYMRSAMTTALTDTLCIRMQSLAAVRSSIMKKQIDEMVPLTVDACMAAIYNKLRNIHKAYGKYSTRYPTAPTYTKDLELPLPFALAIQELGSFETHSTEKRYLLVPNLPEGTKHEGRSQESLETYKYQAYIPRLKEYGIPCKSIDPRIKGGSAWWTYKVENNHMTSDLVCTIPPSHYSDMSAILRSLFLLPDKEKKCKDILKLVDKPADYGTRLREMRPGSQARSFMALCHGPDEEWSCGSN